MAEELKILEELQFEDSELSEMESGEATAMEGFADEVAFAQELNACWSFGPLRVCATVVGAGEVRVTGTLFGQTVLSGTLSTSRTRICVSPTVGVAKAQVCVVLDIRGRQVRVEGSLCVRTLPFGKWKCTNFNARLISW